MLPTSCTALSSQPFTEVTMRVQDLSDYEYAHKRLRYDPETGNLYWKVADTVFFKSVRSSKIWNTKYSLTRAGAKCRNGYRQIQTLRGGSIKMVMEHSLIWLMINGDWPEDEIDHINGIKDDNRISNLRCVNRSINMQNRRMHSNNTSGVCGVIFDKKSGNWKSTIKIHGQKRIQKTFKNFDDAVAFRLKIEKEVGDFTERHGRQEKV